MVRYGWALFYGVLPCLQLFGVTGETPRPGTRGFAQLTVAAEDDGGVTRAGGGFAQLTVAGRDAMEAWTRVCGAGYSFAACQRSRAAVKDAREATETGTRLGIRTTGGGRAG